MPSAVSRRLFLDDGTPLDPVNGRPLHLVAIAHIRDLEASARDVAAFIVSLVAEVLRYSVGRTDTPEQDTQGLEMFLWNFWAAIRDIAVRGAPYLQDRIVDVMHELKQHGRTGSEGLRVWGEPLDWEVLPLFGADVAESLNVGPAVTVPGRVLHISANTPDAYAFLCGAPPGDDLYSQRCAAARTGWLNFIRYLMRAWAVDVCDFGSWALGFMRDGLEALEVASCDAMRKGTLSAAPALALEVASVCVQTAGTKMFGRAVAAGADANSSEALEKRRRRRQRQHVWNGVDDYHLERWELWKSVFREYASVEGKEGIWPNAVEAAKAAIVAMRNIERSHR